MIYSGSYRQLDDLEKTVRRTAAGLRPHLDDFDSIAVSGMSGVLVGAPVALRLKKPLVVVRKRSDDSHHGPGLILNQENAGERALFLDDFESSGATRGWVTERLQRVGVDVVAKYLYATDYEYTGEYTALETDPRTAPRTAPQLYYDAPF